MARQKGKERDARKSRHESATAPRSAKPGLDRLFTQIERLQRETASGSGPQAALISAILVEFRERLAVVLANPLDAEVVVPGAAPSAAKPRGSAPPKETGDVVRVYVLDRLTGEVARQLVVHEHVNDGHDPDDREYRVRCLELSDDEPWTWVDADVEGDALRLFFPEDEYRGFPPFLDLEKPRKPHPGQTWRLRRPDGATAATFVLRSVELSKSSRSEWKHGDIVHAAYEGKSYVARFIRTTRHGAALVHWAGDGTFSEIPIEDIIGASKERWVLELEGEDVEVEY